MFEGPPGAKRPRKRGKVREQVAEYVAAYANADGGVLVLGIEDDGTVTGHSGLPSRCVSCYRHRGPCWTLRSPLGSWSRTRGRS